MSHPRAYFKGKINLHDGMWKLGNKWKALFKLNTEGFLLKDEPLGRQGCCLEMVPSQKGTWGCIRNSHLGRRPDKIPWVPRDWGREENKPSASLWVALPKPAVFKLGDNCLNMELFSAVHESAERIYKGPLPLEPPLCAPRPDHHRAPGWAPCATPPLPPS